MSECIVRMEMPQGCLCCPCVNGEYGYCQADKDERQIEDPNGRPSWRPIICSLPEGHGRLVDAELVKEILKPVDSISHYEPEWTWGELHENNCVAIDNAPTIVPAEAERSET